MFADVAVETDASGLGAWFARARQRLNVEVMRALERTVELAAAYAKQSRLFTNRTGRLRASITGRAFGGFGGILGDSASARVFANAPYARPVEKGQVPHYIEARRARVLRFVQNGAVRFARFVHHPGAKPRPFMADAQARTEPLFERLVGEAVVRVFA